jgi:cobalt/nickel transport system permease protein
VAGHLSVHGLHHDVASVVHRIDPAAKLVATLAFVLAVVATPREAMWAFALHLAVVVAVAGAARLPARTVVRRARVEVPFLAFAVFLPLVGESPRVDVLGLSLSEPGLWAAWNIVAKGTLGVLAAIVLAATTPVPDLLAGLRRLRVPRVLVAITALMVRYLDVLTGEASRMRIARLSRGDDPRWLWQGRAVAASAGTLFVRAFERGERVHLAMLARGWTGAMPDLHDAPRHRSRWLPAAAAPAASLAVLLAAVVTVP